MSYVDTSTGEIRTVYLFAATLPYSQYSYVEPCLDMKIVGKIATVTIAKLRNEVFYSFEDLKSAVARKLYEFNHKRFQKKEGTRYGAYLDEKESLHALPAAPYEIATSYPLRLPVPSHSAPPLQKQTLKS